MAALTRFALVSSLTASMAVPLLGIATPAQAAAERVRAEGPWVSYNATLVPADATARVQEVRTASGSTVVTLQVRGLRANREYGAHAHVNACGATGGAAGPHYQDVIAPTELPNDPAYANPDNEVWLDFTTDDEGNGSAQALVRWQFRSGGANSVVMHDHATATDPGTAGTAGPRLACFTVPF